MARGHGSNPKLEALPRDIAEQALKLEALRRDIAAAVASIEEGHVSVAQAVDIKGMAQARRSAR